MSGDPLDLTEPEAQERAESRGQDEAAHSPDCALRRRPASAPLVCTCSQPPQQHRLDGTKKPAALLHVETDVDVVLDALARWHNVQPVAVHPGGFDLCPASPCRDVREAL